MLQVNNIEVVYANIIQVLRGVSLEVGSGKIVALLGANGAGKTTTIKAISGLLKTEEGKIIDGSIFFDGKRIDKLKAQDIAVLGRMIDMMNSWGSFHQALSVASSLPY